MYLPAEVLSDFFFPFLDPTTDAITCRVLCRAFKKGWQLHALNLAPSFQLSIGFGRYLHPWKSIRFLNQCYPSCQHITVTHTWAMTPQDRLALIVLFSHVVTMDFGTSRGSIVPFELLDEQDSIGMHDTSTAAIENNAPRHLRDIRQGRHIRYNPSHHDTATVPIISAQCWNLQTLTLGKGLGNITTDIMSTLISGCPLMTSIELGAGSTSCRLGFDSVCLCLNQWKQLKDFRYGGTIHRGSFRPQRPPISSTTTTTTTARNIERNAKQLCSFHISYGTLSSSMLRHLTPFIQLLEELTLSITASQVKTLTDMATLIEEESDSSTPLFTESKMDTRESKEDPPMDHSNGRRHESKCATPSTSPSRHYHTTTTTTTTTPTTTTTTTTANGTPRLRLKALTLVKPLGMGTLPPDAVIKLMSVCPSLLHLQVFGVNELNHNLFQACSELPKHPLQTLMMFNYSNWRSSIERGLTRVVNRRRKYQHLQHLSMCNMNDDVLKHIMTVCGTTLVTLSCLRSPNVTDRGLSYISQPHLQLQQETPQQQQQQSLQQPLHHRRKSILQHIALDNVNVSTDAVLNMCSCLPLRTLYLGASSPIISNATLGTLINLLTQTGECTHIWLINTLTTSSGACSSLKDMVLHKNGNVRSLEELFCAEFSSECCQEISDMWRHVRIVRPGQIWSRENNKGDGPPRNGKERLSRSLSSYLSSMCEHGVR